MPINVQYKVVGISVAVIYIYSKVLLCRKYCTCQQWLRGVECRAHLVWQDSPPPLSVNHMISQSIYG